MRSFKKTFLAGLIFWFVIWGVKELYKLIHSTVEPVRGFLLRVFDLKIPGAELVATMLIIMVFGFLIITLGRLKSSVPGVNQFFGLTRMISGISHKIETGKIKVVLMNGNNSHFLVFTTGVTEIINEKKFIVVFRPFTPNITAGFSYLVPEEEFQNLPLLLGKQSLKILFHGWLSQIKS